MADECGVCLCASQSWVSTSNECRHRVCSVCYDAMTRGAPARRVDARAVWGQWFEEAAGRRCSACGRVHHDVRVFARPSPFGDPGPLSMCDSCLMLTSSASNSRPPCPFCRA